MSDSKLPDREGWWRYRSNEKADWMPKFVYFAGDGWCVLDGRLNVAYMQGTWGGRIHMPDEPIRLPTREAAWARLERNQGTVLDSLIYYAPDPDAFGWRLAAALTHITGRPVVDSAEEEESRR